jgi:hypothetical protein
VDSPHIAKLLSIYKREVITIPEIANGILVDLIRNNSPDTELPSFVTELPNEVQQNLRDLLRKIQKADYCWKPFTLGPGGSVLHSEADDSARLRRLCVVLEIA